MPATQERLRYPVPTGPSDPTAKASGGGDAGAGPLLDSASLLQGRREIGIRHGTECYRLRETRNGKLILTK